MPVRAKRWLTTFHEGRGCGDSPAQVWVVGVGASVDHRHCHALAGANLVRHVGPQQLGAIGQFGVGIVRCGLQSLESLIGLHQLDSRIGFQLGDYGL